MNFDSSRARDTNELPTPWLASLVELALKKCCRGDRSNLQRLHTLTWGLLSETSFEQIYALSESRIQPGEVVLQFLPGLSSALVFGVEQGRLEMLSNSRVQLTERGNAHVDQILKTDALFEEEIARMNKLGHKLTQKKVGKYARGL